jgi:DNA (cytosine-5)-methyltransferase 1
LSDKQLEQISNLNAQQNPLENTKTIDDETVQCITVKSNTSMNASMLLIKETTDETICLNSKVNGKQPSVQDKIYDVDGVSTAITTAYMPSIAIPEATTKGYALAKDGDGKYLNRPHQKRGVVQDQMIQTIKTSGNDIGVVTNNLRIRKLTPLECWRLMGISDDDFNKAQASGVSNSQLYKQAGNAIVVDVFEAILRRMIT